MRNRTDKFEVLMLMMTALCCSVALVSCGKTAKSRDAEKRAVEIAEQKRADDARKAAEKAKADQVQAENDRKAREDALRAQEEAEKKKRLAATGGATPAPGTGRAGATTVPAPIGVNNKDGKDSKDKKDNKDGKGSGPAPTVVQGAPGATGQQGGQGPAGRDGKDGKDGQTLVVGGGQGGQVAPGTQPGAQGGSSVVPPGNPPGREQAGLSTDFASEGLDLLTLGQAEATWVGCTITAATLGQPAANQQGMKERFTVEKNGAFHRTRQLHQGSDCATPILSPEPQLDGDLKIVSREVGSTADAISYKLDLTYFTFGAPTQGQSQQAAPKSTIQTLIRIERQSGTLYFAKQPEAGQPRPTTVDGGYKLKHN